MSRGTQVRDTIELLCKILKENGMSHIEAETLRKAKFDKAEACVPLWRLLFELIFFCQHGLMSSGIFKSFINMASEDQVNYVKKEMQKRGYLSRAFASLPGDMQRGSRELVLAMAWLLNKESIITTFMNSRASPIEDDILSLYESMESEETWTPAVFGEKQQTAAQRVQQMLVLNNKLKMNLRLLHASQQEYASLTHRIHNATHGASLSPDMPHLTTLQTHMLRHPQYMKKALTLLEEDSIRLEHLLQWEDKNTIFWEWMESVLELKLQQMTRGRESVASDADVGGADDDMVQAATPTIFLDVPPNIGAEIAESRKNLMNMILHYETALERLEDLWTTKRSKVSEWELDYLLQEINREITQLQTSMRQPPRTNNPERPPSCRGPRLMLLKNKPRERGPVKLSNAMAASSQDSGNQKEEVVSIQAEISRLQQEASELEQELLEMRRHCLNKLNSKVAAVPNTVCILPSQVRRLGP